MSVTMRRTKTPGAVPKTGTSRLRDTNCFSLRQRRRGEKIVVIVIIVVTVVIVIVTVTVIVIVIVIIITTTITTTTRRLFRSRLLTSMWVTSVQDQAVSPG